jgi:hypothetical protein
MPTFLTINLMSIILSNVRLLYTPEVYSNPTYEKMICVAFNI